jgi:O-antigen/teichoic acid export membrane protein
MNQSAITTSKRLILNTGLNMLTHIITALIGFCLIKFFLAQLGELKYGIWVLVASIFRYRMMMTMGLNSAINRYVPVYLAQANSIGIQKIVSTSFFFLVSVGLILCLLSIYISYNFGEWFEVPPEFITTASRLVLIIGFSFALVMPLQLASAVLSGIQRYDIINTITLIVLISRTVLLVLLLYSGYSLLVMGYIFGGSEILIRILQFVFSRKLLPQASISYRHIDLKLLREMMGYGVNTILYTMGALILYKASDIVIGIFLGTEQISYFSIATAAALLLAEFTQVFSSAVKPAISDLDARSDHQKVRDLSFLTQKYTLLLLIPACSFFVFMGRNFLSVWVGDRISDVTVLDTMATIMAVFTIGHAFRLAQHSNFIVLVGRGEHKIFGIFSLSTAAFFVVISVIFLRVFNMGIVSIAWANFIPIMITSGILLPLYFNHKMKITVYESIDQVWLPAIKGTLPGVSVILIWHYFASPESWLHLVAVSAVSVVTVFAGSWLFSISPVEKKRILATIRR